MLKKCEITKVAVLTSGGDAPGMNACIRAVTRAAMDKGASVIGIKRGYSGIFEKSFVELDSRTVANTIQRGGTILESSRCEEFMTPGGRKKAYKILEKEGVQGLVVIGGNGSFTGAAAMCEEASVNWEPIGPSTRTSSHGKGDLVGPETASIKVVGVPGTIDNDVYGTDYTIGFDTAVNTAVEAIDRIRDTADAFARVFFIEVMGRKSGFIALEVGVAAGAEEILVPEKSLDPEDLSQTLKESFQKGKRSSIVVVAEGNETGHTIQISQYVQYRLKLDCRVCVLGHLQRGGTPTARDRVLASRLGTAAIDGLYNAKHCCAVGEVGGKIRFTPMREAAEQKKKLDIDLLDRMGVLAS